MKFTKQIVFLIGATFFASCSTDPYNAVTEKTHDRQEHSQYVYGDGKGKPARQTQNKYTSTPDDQKRADAIREKMFGKGISAEASPAPTDNAKDAKKDDAKKEDVKKDAKKEEKTEKK